MKDGNAIQGIYNGVLLSIPIWILIAILTIGCGPTHHLKRAAHHINKAKEKGAKIAVDTVFTEVEVIVPELRVKREIEYKTLRDTIFIDVERVKVVLKVDTVNREIFVDVTCPPDTLKVEVQVPCEKIKAGYSKFELAGFSIILLIVGLIVGLNFGRISERFKR